MQGEKVKIKAAMTLMALVILWGINTSAGVINRWMDHTVAPQIFDLERVEDQLEIDVLGYSFLIGKETWDNILKDAINELNALEKTAVGEYQKMLPIGKNFIEQIIQEGRNYIKEKGF